jgi:hypothetical protein
MAIERVAPEKIIVSTAETALTVTQAGTGNAFVVEDSTNPDATPFVIDASGNVGVGTSSPTTKLEVAGTVTVTGADRFVGHGAVYSVTSTTRPGSPVKGDIIYETDTNLFYGWNGTIWASIGGGGGAKGGGTDDVFYENSTTITTSYSITAGKNAVTAGPITINSGAVVTVPSGSVWTVV